MTMPFTLDHDGIRELLGAYAVDAVSPEERELIAVHLATCPECSEELGSQLEALALLTPETQLEPDWATWEKVRAHISETPVAPASDRESDSRGKVIRMPRRFTPVAAALAVAACSVLATLAFTHDWSSPSPLVTAPIVSANPSEQLAGSVKLFAPDKANGRVVLDLRNVPDAPAGHHYEVWVLRPGEGTEMEPIGAFTPRNGHAALSLRLPGPGEYVALDISVQENGGSPVHSGTSLGGAKLTS